MNDTMIDSGRHPLSGGCPPDWASGWGEDRFGVFTTFTVGDVSQTMRWIPPGRFRMGSAKDEPERNDSEGPQHEVTIAQGFWLFDTACTQKMWMAVMDDNPARFQDDVRNPVERVSWNDAHAFLARINERIPGLALTLPSEAQWEYACRAGTTTPFSFGATITPDQVNYNGKFPYLGGVKGVYRQETVPVGRLPPNPWGLYEMHGNVSEWCADAAHSNYDGAPIDGTAWTESERAADAMRVLRGGSWSDDARAARSACRLWLRPDVRYDDLDFRCACVQP